MSEPTKRILITGGTGLIGRHLVHELVSQGYRAIVTTRRPAEVAPREGVEVVGWDAQSAVGIMRAIDNSFAVVQLVGAPVMDKRWTAGYKRRIRDSRVQSTRAIAAAIEQVKRKPQVLLQGSAVGYYGDTGARDISEEDGAGNDFLAQVVRLWEQASEPVERHGVRRPIVRTGIVLAADGGALPKLMQPFKLFAGGRLGSGTQAVPWIHIRDQVAAMRFLIEHDQAHGPYNLTAPQPVTNAELTRALSELLHRPALLPVPRMALRLALGQASEALLAGQRALPQRLQSLGYSFQFPELREALADLLQR